MTLEFELGDEGQPAGHAVLYFRSYHDETKIFATYLVVPPINIELAKYMPPMFASKVSMADMENVSSIPLPPVPEEVKNYSYLKSLAQSRGDDLIYGGVVDTSDVERMLYSTSDAAQTYLRLYNERAPVISATEEEMPPEGEATNIGEVLYALMSDRDRLSELVKLTGSLRYAVEGNDQTTADEIRREMQNLAKYMNEKFRVNELIDVAAKPGLVASKLSALYTDRCYKLCEEDYRAVAEIEKEIQRLKTS